MKPLSFAARVRLAFLAALTAVIALCVATAYLFPSPWAVLLVAVGFGLPVGWWFLDRALLPATGGRGGGLPRRPPGLRAQRPAARPHPGQAAHPGAAPPGGGRLEAGDPHPLARAQQLARPHRFARPLGAADGGEAGARGAPRLGPRRHRGARRPSQGVPGRVRPLRPPAAAGQAGGGAGPVPRRAPAGRPLRARG